MKRNRLIIISVILIILYLLMIGINRYKNTNKASEKENNIVTIHSKLNSLDSNNLNEWETERKEIKNNINRFLGDSPKNKVNLDSKIISQEDMGEYIRTKVSYYVEKNDLVTAYLLVPKNIKEPSQTVLALHQTTKDGKNEVVGLTNNEEMNYGEDLVKQGFIVLAPDALSAGERIFKGYSEYDSKPFYEKNPEWSMVGKAIWDNQRAVDYLMTLDIVDDDNIMVVGHSIGGVDALFLAAFDQRISAVAMNCGLLTIKGNPDPYRWSRDSWYIAFPKLKDYLDKGEIPFDFHEIVALVAPRPILSLSGSEDSSFPYYQGVFEISNEASKIYELYDKKENLNISVFNGDHTFPKNNKMYIYNWLKTSSHKSKSSLNISI